SVGVRRMPWPGPAFTELQPVLKRQGATADERVKIASSPTGPALGGRASMASPSTPRRQLVAGGIRDERRVEGACSSDSQNGLAARILLDFDADAEKIRNEIIRMLSGPGRRQQGGGAAAGEKTKSSKLLDQFGRNLTKQASEGKLDPVVGRQTEIERVMQILSRRTKNNPVLIGEPGVGKTAVVAGLAARISNNHVPELLKNTQIYP